MYFCKVLCHHGVVSSRCCIMQYVLKDTSLEQKTSFGINILFSSAPKVFNIVWKNLFVYCTQMVLLPKDVIEAAMGEVGELILRVEYMILRTFYYCRFRRKQLFPCIIKCYLQISYFCSDYRLEERKKLVTPLWRYFTLYLLSLGKTVLFKVEVVFQFC